MSACGQCHNCMSGGPCYQPTRHRDSDPRDTDRIADQTAELAEARRVIESKDLSIQLLTEARERYSKKADDERADHERTKAELAEARRRENDNVAAYDELETKFNAVEAERDAAQADAAAMLIILHQVMGRHGAGSPCHVLSERLEADFAKALASNAGRDLLARVTLWWELEKRVQAYWDADGRDSKTLNDVFKTLFEIVKLDEKESGS